MTTSTAEGRKHESATIGLVALAHGNSHMMQLTLPPLFLILYNEFNVTYTQLGLVVTLLYGASGLTQAAAGMLADRYGAHRMIIGGTALLSGSIAMYGMVPEFWMMMPLAVLAGLGNSVFHPSDLAVLSHRVRESWLGRAYALHNVSGMLGYAIIPGIMTALAAFGGWRFALIAVGMFGVGVAVLLLVCYPLLVYQDRAPAKPVAGAAKPTSPFALLTQPVILAAFFYFALVALAGLGVQAFMVTVATTGYGVPLATATVALTVYLVGNAAGQLTGGLIAERTAHHDRVAVTGIATTAVLMLLLAYLIEYAWFAFPALFIAGLTNGATGPSRDVLIRKAASGGRLGGTFGIVYSGLDLGSLLAPLLFGMLLDHGMAQVVFIVIAILFAMGIPTVLEMRRRIVTPAALPAAATN